MATGNSSKRAYNFKDITGDRFGGFTVLRRGPKYRKQWTWLCRCECGTKTFVTGGNLRSGLSTNCGCRRKETLRRLRTTHGGSTEPLYQVWASMHSRCRDKNRDEWENYGGRGIKVCEEWTDYGAFREWAEANGYRNGLEIDRRDNEYGYSPDNCRFVTKLVNANNKRNNILLTAWGETKTAKEWSRDARCVVSYNGLKWRIRAGVAVETALTTPSRREA